MNKKEVEENSRIIENLKTNHSKTFNNINDKIYETENPNVDSDIKILLESILFLFLFLLKLPFNILLGIFSKKEGGFKKIKTDFFKIFKVLSKYFSQAKNTTLILIFIWLGFLTQIIFGEIIIDLFASTQTDLFSIRIYTFITSLFLHGGLTHILSNSIALLIFSRYVEHVLKSKIIIFFLIMGFFSNFISSFISYYFFKEEFLSIGASGAIAGIIMLGILLKPFRFTFGIPLFVIGWALIFLDVVGLTNPSQINHLAHISGYSSIFLIFIFLKKDFKNSIKKGIMINILFLLVFLLVFFLFDLKNKIPNF